VRVDFGDPVNLKVDYTKGVATASIWVPGDFGIISPDTSQIAYIPVDSSFTVIRSTSNHCDFYLLHFSPYYWFYDTSGDYRYFDLYVGTAVTTTSITFPARRLFPTDLARVDKYSHGHFVLSTRSGPRIEPGAAGNITGDGSGSFWITSYSPDLEVAVQGTERKSADEPPRKELTEKFFEKAKEMGANYQLRQGRWLSKR